MTVDVSTLNYGLDSFSYLLLYNKPITLNKYADKILDLFEPGPQIMAVVEEFRKQGKRTVVRGYDGRVTFTSQETRAMNNPKGFHEQFTKMLREFNASIQVTPNGNIDIIYFDQAGRGEGISTYPGNVYGNTPYEMTKFTDLSDF